MEADVAHAALGNVDGERRFTLDCRLWGAYHLAPWPSISPLNSGQVPCPLLCIEAPNSASWRPVPPWSRQLPASPSDSADSRSHREATMHRGRAMAVGSHWAGRQRPTRHAEAHNWDCDAPGNLFPCSERKGQRAAACSPGEWPPLSCPSLTSFSLSLF